MKAKLKAAKGAGVLVEVDEKVFPRSVTVAAAYVFIDRCYLRLERGERGRLAVRMKAKPGQPDAAVKDLAADFENELLHQLMRHQVSESTAGLREVLVGRALLSAEPQDSPEGAAPGCESCADQDYLDDPLGIAVPWEEKYGDEAKDSKNGPHDENDGQGKHDKHDKKEDGSGA
jgi:His-Xaa-Ser system protein HxsD